MLPLKQRRKSSARSNLLTVHTRISKHFSSELKRRARAQRDAEKKAAKAAAAKAKAPASSSSSSANDDEELDPTAYFNNRTKVLQEREAKGLVK